MIADAAQRPVLLEEAVAGLALKSKGIYIDATFGRGGHSRRILDVLGDEGRVVAIDRDPAAEAEARTWRDSRFSFRRAWFSELPQVLDSTGVAAIDGVLFDLGVSSFHLDASGRGFSSQRDEPLDMRFDAGDSARETAADLLATRGADELSALFRTYGEERFASRIARTIVARRRVAPLRTSGELLAAIEQSLPPHVRWRAGRDAARVFQALRIAVNGELEAVADALPQALDALAPGGRLVVIAFHSLEDRLTKRFLRDAERAGRVRVLTKRPIQAGDAEIAANPRAASAKLRAAERM